MFRPLFLIHIKSFQNNSFPCSGQQLASIVRFLQKKLPLCYWYGADISAPGKLYTPPTPNLIKIGDHEKLMSLCSLIEQFESGVFIAVTKEIEFNKMNEVVLETEDEQFRTIDLDGVLIEIRAFDTSNFEVYSEDPDLIKEISINIVAQKSDNESYNAKYTWNDSVVINKEAPNQFHPGKIGIICGMSKIPFEVIAKKYDSKLGDLIYTVGFDDGNHAQVPERFLEKYDARSSTSNR